jgi:hypothetical protein
MSVQVDILLERNVDYSGCWAYADEKKEVIDITDYDAYMFIKEAGHQEEVELMLDRGYGLTICGADGVVNVFIKCEQIKKIDWRTGHHQIILRNKYGKKLPFIRGTLTIK